MCLAFICIRQGSSPAELVKSRAVQLHVALMLMGNGMRRRGRRAPAPRRSFTWWEERQELTLKKNSAQTHVSEQAEVAALVFGAGIGNAFGVGIAMGLCPVHSQNQAVLVWSSTASAEAAATEQNESPAENFHGFLSPGRNSPSVAESFTLVGGVGPGYS